MHRGYIKLWRKSLESAVWANPKLWRFWTWCLLKATYIERMQRIGYQEVKLLPGQFVFGRKRAALETGLSEQEVRTALDYLRKSQNLTVKTTNKFSVISIVKWDEYQSESTNNLTSRQPTNNQQITTNKKDKNYKNQKKDSTPPPSTAAVFKLFEENYQKITERISSLLKNAIDEYTEGWIIDALNEGIERNKCSWKYVEAILKRWKAEGRSDVKHKKDYKDDPDKYIKGRYGHVVQRS